MAKKDNNVKSTRHMRTSDGDSNNSRPKNKQRRRSFKPSRGQGKP